MTLSERTNATILNILNGVRYNPLLLSPYPLGRTLRFTSLPSGLLVLRLAPVSTRLGPFCSGLDLCEAPPFRSVQICLFVVHLGSFVCVATGASVHRRGRCIGVSLPLANDMSLVLVLVCLSVDVTAALALPNSFCVEYLHVLHAPPHIYPFCHLALLWSGVCCLLLPCRCCPPPFCLCCLCVFACGSRWDLRFLAFPGFAGSLPFSVLCALFLCGFRCFRVACSPLLCFLSLFFLPPLPRG